MKTRVALVYGGRSGEHEISLLSAESVIAAINPDRYELTRYLIDKQGHVAKTKAESGHPILIQAAMDAVKNWDYQPFMLNGEPTEVETSVTVKFKP